MNSFPYMVEIAFFITATPPPAHVTAAGPMLHHAIKIASASVKFKRARLAIIQPVP